jgi:hypothetical protein
MFGRHGERLRGRRRGGQIPFLAIRVISNSEYTHPKFERGAGTYCAQFVVGLIRAIK